MAYATERAKILLGCYRQGEAADPDTYVAAIAVVLADYGKQIITDVTHPKTGLPHKIAWLPTVKDVFDACEEFADLERRILARESRIQRQFAEREQHEQIRSQAPSYEQLKAKYGPNFGLSGKPVPKIDPREQARARERTERMILREYQAKGLEPRYTSDGTLLSLSLVRLLETAR